ncbi:immune inhibitor A [Macrococcus armenti]|uniref:immune inhibitor A n=2 Tax=Macrococcus armenti TaxID=2875764 RepID=UPI001CCD99C1|nr:immune inhibitor A [Macrococcus armenti]UBH09107.1 immune inhibitor A [Macrococcus armenti]
MKMNPVNLSPYAKMQIQRIYGGDWIHINEVDYKNISKKKVKGKIRKYKRYYLIEWRNHTGLDLGL